MNPTTEAVARWYAVQVNFGGEWMTRAEVMQWFADQGYPPRAGELWLIGNARTS